MRVKCINKKDKKIPVLSYKERLIKSKAIDLKDNCIFTDLGNGYCKIEAIDKTKLVK